MKIRMAIIIPSVFLAIGIALILKLPNKRREGKVLIDISGIVTLALALIGIILSSSLCGIAYDFHVKVDPKNIANIMAGVNSVFLIIGVINIIGFLIVIFVVRDQMNNKAENKG